MGRSLRCFGAPGTWMPHCHNGYRVDAGMMTTLN
jgi:FtsP/CotA-like multicopper oxidase with cupredoxin domain